jgi:pimeloyl-ACP methyl ester carboxylesterase
MTQADAPPVGAPHHATVVVNGVRWHYVRAGAGPTVLLLHGWPQDSSEWNQVLAHLTPTFDIVAPDLPGSGSSGPAVGARDTTTLARELAQFLDLLGIARVDIVGHDWGSVWGQSLAADRPERVGRLIALDMMVPGTGHHEAGMVPAADGAWFWHMAFQSVPAVPEALIRGRETAYVAENITTYSADPTAVGPAAIRRYAERMRRPGALRTSLRTYQEFFDDADQVQQRLHDTGPLTCPVLAIGGEACVGARTGNSFRRLAHDVTEVILPTGHWIPEEAPGRLAAMVREFLCSDDPSTAAPSPDRHDDGVAPSRNGRNP